MKKLLSLVLTLCLLASIFAGCGNASSSNEPEASAASGSESSQTSQATQPAQPTPSGEKKEVKLWFWSAAPNLQALMRAGLVDKVNSSQNDYELNVTFNAGNDRNIATALAANEGPDIIFTSGPTIASTYAAAGKMENMNEYSEKYGWKDRLLEPIYNLGTYKGDLYSVCTSLMVMGVFYNKKVLADNGWEVPKTIEEMESIMDEAIAKGMYGNLGGNKGWKPINTNFYSLFFNHIAGPDTVYKCLTGETKWNNPDMVAALEKSSEWYHKGYFSGDNYYDLNFDECVQLLAMGKAPFFVGPSNVFQWAPNYFRGLTMDDFGFFPFPETNANVKYPTYTLGVTGCFSINAYSKYKDECAEILNYVMTNDFMVDMTKDWPGYWAIPLKEYNIPEDTMTGISAVFCDVLPDVLDAINNGNYGYYGMSFFPPATDVALQDIDTIWMGTASASEVLSQADVEFEKELQNEMVLPIPERK